MTVLVGHSLHSPQLQWLALSTESQWLSAPSGPHWQLFLAEDLEKQSHNNLREYFRFLIATCRFTEKIICIVTKDQERTCLSQWGVQRVYIFCISSGKLPTSESQSPQHLPSEGGGCETALHPTQATGYMRADLWLSGCGCFPRTVAMGVFAGLGGRNSIVGSMVHIWMCVKDRFG